VKPANSFVMIATATLLFLAAIPESQAADAAPQISVSYESCHRYKTGELEQAQCAKFDMDVDAQGVVSITGDYCKRDEPCTGKLAQEDMAKLRDLVAKFDFVGFAKAPDSCPYATDFTKYRIRSNPQAQPHLIEHQTPCGMIAKDAQFHQFETIISSTLKPRHYGFFQAYPNTAGGCNIADTRKNPDEFYVTGTVEVELDLDANGRVLSEAISRSSGFKVLDRMTLKGKYVNPQKSPNNHN